MQNLSFVENHPESVVALFVSHGEHWVPLCIFTHNMMTGCIITAN
jgi:hypothetical protein